MLYSQVLSCSGFIGECRALRIIEELRLCYILGLSCSGFMENAEL